MKKILSIIIIGILLFSLKSIAQELKSGDYVPSPENKKFEGTWQFIKNDVNVKVFLKNKERVMLKGFDLYFDSLDGKITYIKNGVTTLNNTDFINGGSSKSETLSILNALSSDRNGVGGKVVISFPDPRDLNTIKIIVKKRPYPNGLFEVKPSNFPTSLTLVRVKD